MLDRGDLDGQTVWKRIRRAIVELQAPQTDRLFEPREDIATAIRPMLALAILMPVTLLLPGAVVALSPSAPLVNFPTEAQAHQRRPADIEFANMDLPFLHSRDDRAFNDDSLILVE